MACDLCYMHTTVKAVCESGQAFQHVMSDLSYYMSVSCLCYIKADKSRGQHVLTPYLLLGCTELYSWLYFDIQDSGFS